LLSASPAGYLASLELIAERIVPDADFPSVDGVPMCSAEAVRAGFSL